MRQNYQMPLSVLSVRAKTKISQNFHFNTFLTLDFVVRNKMCQTLNFQPFSTHSDIVEKRRQNCNVFELGCKSNWHRQNKGNPKNEEKKKRKNENGNRKRIKVCNQFFLQDGPFDF